MLFTIYDNTFNKLSKLKFVMDYNNSKSFIELSNQIAVCGPFI